MRTQRFLFGTLLFSCLLLLLTQHARFAWAKDANVLTVEGSITVNTAASTVRIRDMVLHVDEGTYLSIDGGEISPDDEDTTFANLAEFVRRNPDAFATGEYMVMDAGDVATQIFVDTSREVAGRLEVDPARGTITVNQLTLNYDAARTSIYIDDNDASLDDLANYLAQNPDTLGAVVFVTDGSQRYLTEVDVNTLEFVAGPLSVDAAQQQVTVSGVQLAVSDVDTIFTINDEQVGLTEFMGFAQRNSGLRASAYYHITDGVIAADEVDVSTLEEIAGPLTVDVSGNQVTINSRRLPVSDRTSFYINGSPATFADFAAYAQRNPAVPGRAQYTADDQHLTLLVWVATQRYLFGAISVDLGAAQATVDTTTAAVRPATEISINLRKATLQDLAAFLDRNPGLSASATVVVDQLPYFSVITVATISTTPYGTVTGDPAGNTVTAADVTAAVIPESRFFADSELLIAADFFQWLAQHPVNWGWVQYAVDAGSVTLVEVHAFSQNFPTAPAVRRSRVLGRAPAVAGPTAGAQRTALAKQPVKTPARGPIIHGRTPSDMVGLLTGVDAAHHTLTFIPRGVGRPMVVQVRPRTSVELNAAQLPFAQLAQTFGPGQQLWMEMLYERSTHVASRVWVEQSLRSGAGQVLAVSPRAVTGSPGLTLTVAGGYDGKGPRVASMQLQLLAHSIVMKGRRLIRPDQIRRGDSIRFDGFTQSGKNYMPRILVLSAKKR